MLLHLAVTVSQMILVACHFLGKHKSRAVTVRKAAQGREGRTRTRRLRRCGGLRPAALPKGLPAPDGAADRGESVCFESAGVGTVRREAGISY